MRVLGLDIGALTVDLACLEDGGVRSAKMIRRLGNPVDDIVAAVAHAGQTWGIRPGQWDEIRIGSTGMINMLLARNIARVGLITTSGFADTLILARQNRIELYNPVAASPSPTFLVAEHSTYEVAGRLDKDGQEMTPLSADDVRRAGQCLVASGAQAIAVCFLFSHLNPAHEMRCAEILKAVAPQIPVVLSHQVDAQAREYERTVSTCLEAALRPSQVANISAVEHELHAAGFAGRLSFADSRGYLQSGGNGSRSVGSQIMGGPAASALVAARLAQDKNAETALAIDVGSTTTDIVLVADGAPLTATHGIVAGVPVRMPMLDVESVAIGGGTKADTLLPLADGSRGIETDAATLTDALVFLSELPDELAPNARSKLSALASSGGEGLSEIAARIKDAALDRIASAIVRYAVSRNVDPAAVPLIVSGGLGPVIGAAIAERTGAREVLAAPHASTAGSVGLLLARHVHEARVKSSVPLDALTDAAMGEALLRLQESAPEALDGDLYATVAPNSFMHAVDLKLEAGATSVDRLQQAFVNYHVARFGNASREPGFVFGLRRLLLEAPLHLSLPGDQTLAKQNASRSPRPETLQMRLNAIAQSMQELLFRTAVSPVVREGNDASAGLLTPDGQIIALSDAIPLLLGALDGSARAILARFPAQSMCDGDLYVMNDPFMGGTHLPDLTVLRPIFEDGRLVALAASILHHQDVGGMRAGSVPPDAVDIFQEGLRLPPMRLGGDDRIGQEMVDLVHANSRAPQTVLGDLSSQIAAAVQAGRSVSKLAREVGVDAFFSGMQTCLERGEELARKTIASMAPGPHRATERLDPVPGLPDVKIELALTCKDGRFVADFAGTSAQIAAPINCVRSGPFAAAFYSLLSAMGDTMFRNGGVIRAVELKLPEGCAINASLPAAVNARMGIVRATTSSLLQALAKAMPQRMPAANSGMSYVLAFSGTRPDGHRFIVTEIIAGGAGGGPDHDAASGISTDVGNAMNMPAEALESQIPVRVVRSEIRQGSGGAGRFRGGDGIRRTYCALQDGIGVSLRGERFFHGPQGVAGGGAPELAAARVVRADGTCETMRTRSTPVLNTGDLLIVESCGGAGYGVIEEKSHS
jgi:N-methylhydantoinase B